MCVLSHTVLRFVVYDRLIQPHDVKGLAPVVNDELVNQRTNSTPPLLPPQQGCRSD